MLEVAPIGALQKHKIDLADNLANLATPTTIHPVAVTVPP